MILVDTSVWIAHFRSGDSRLQSLLEEDRVLSHPFVIGELALGHLKKRGEIISHLHALPFAPLAEPDEVLDFIERRGLSGCGVGYVDAHLLASASVAKASLWTYDARLRLAAERLDIAPRLN